ncbi:MAG TPA: GAF domain-containing protein [Gemmatimonadales bacterium]|nr:GAF domain-containing protein [Gemmatimonadales bacterium]
MRRHAELKDEIESLRQSLAEALEQRTATGAILHAISRSPRDLPAVLDAVVSNAARLSHSANVSLYQVEGDRMRKVAEHEDGPQLTTLRVGETRPISRTSVSGRAIIDRTMIHVLDHRSAEVAREFPDGARRDTGIYTTLGFPLLSDGRAIGAFTVYRTEHRSFSESEIALLQTFADQAVIAIENVRLFTELQTSNHELTTALEQQTATSEILRVMSSSPTNLQPVLDAIATNAALVCHAYDAIVFLREGDRLRYAAHYGPIKITLQRATLSRGSVTDAAVLDRQPVHVHDLLATEPPAFPLTAKAAREGGFRAVLSVPLLRENEAIGALSIRRREVQPFTDRQIALLQTFADQAVIAIENVRLFNETKEALDTQTATSDILRVISRSQTDVQPVFDAVAESAARLCDAFDVTIFRRDGDRLRLVAHHGRMPVGTMGDFSLSVSRETVGGRSVIDAVTLNLEDVQADAGEFPEGVGHARRFGHRAMLSVPLTRDGAAIGVIQLRRTEPGRFTDRQVALLQTFADQAVIAIENVRLFTELQEKNQALTEAHAHVTEALEQQTATGEILRVISGSPTDVQPVFETILDSATRLCSAENGILFQYDDGAFHTVACLGLSPKAETAFRTQPARPGPHSGLGRMLAEKRPVQVADVTDDIAYRQGDPLRAITVTLLGARTAMWLPLLKSDAVVGALSIYRRDVRPFTAKQIDLVGTFADQAVIAIENVRLFTELQEKNRALTQAHAQVTETLEQQTATSEILRVISRSQTDVQPVFDTIVESAVRLCDARYGAVFNFDGDLVHLVAHHNFSETWLEGVRKQYPMRPSRAHISGRAILSSSVVQIPDVALDHEYGSPLAVQRGFRSLLAVPILRSGAPIGSIVIYRPESGQFPDSEIELLKTFAEQAVIAVENVRLFTELQGKNRALTQAHAQVTETLDQQTATSEILRTIAHAQTDAQPVFDTIVQNAARLCRATVAAVFRTDGRILYMPANYGGSAEARAVNLERFPRQLDAETTAGQAILARAVIHVPDIEEPSAREFLRQSGRLLGFRSAVTVPMLRENEAVGAITVARLEPGEFSEAEVALLKTFADQAVIAVENVRLFKELQARTADLTRSVEQLTALGEVGRAVSSTLDLETVLTTIVARAVQLSALDGGVVFEYDEGTEEFVQRAGTDPGGALAEARRTTRIRKGEGVLGRTAITLEPIQVPDITVPAAYEGRLREILVESGVRAILAVPMVREGRLLGCLGVTRNQPGDFTAETIEVLRTFATQSALAIQNARLFEEIADKSRQLEAASRHKSEFLANMSHELRTPLNAVIGFSEVLLQRMFGELNEKQDEYLKDIYASGQHLLSLINDILDLSKIEAGRMELAPAPFHLPGALENAVTLVKERASRHGIALQLDIDPRLGELAGDERKVKQVLLNLLSNAVKFTPEGGRITLKAGRTEGMVEIAVTDTGIGIAPEDQAAIFEEFRQVGSDETRKQEGTGLGLTLAKKFVELHGGRIWVESEPGRGATFTFTLPLH